jgi:hypothetical protein
MREENPDEYLRIVTLQLAELILDYNEVSDKKVCLFFLPEPNIMIGDN